MGADIALSLESNGHTVAIIDQHSDAFRRLPEAFDGRRIRGIGFDRETLTEAGIHDAFGFAAVSDGDNSNILAARVVRETFGVENVVARIYDWRRAEIYERLGIPTVATVKWAADQVIRRMLPQGVLSDYRDASGAITLAEVEVHPAWIGQRLTGLEVATGARVGYITRFGRGILPTPDLVYQDNDIVHMLLPTERIGEIEDLAANPPRPEKP